MPSLARPGEGITGVAQGPDAIERFQLLAQAAHQDVHGTGVEIGFGTAQAVQYLIAAEDLFWLGGEQPEKLELGTGEIDGLAVPQHLSAFQIDLDAVECQPLPRCPVPFATQERLDARHQLARLEGFTEIIVGADLESRARSGNSPRAVSMMMGMSLSLRRMRHSSKPSISGIMTSRIAASKASARSRARPMLGSVALSRSRPKLELARFLLLLGVKAVE
jgi:hypothetical protein